MRCLACWRELTSPKALYTKSCLHTFCVSCGEASLKTELVCPLCDTVLPKDGIGELNLQPNDSQINETAATCYGMNPEKLCQVLQMGVSFWATQMANESLMHKEAHKKTSEDLSDCKKKVKEILEMLEKEKLRTSGLRDEKNALKKTVKDLEKRYAEKSRDMRRVTELYEDLRRVHKRLETDLKGAKTPLGDAYNSARNRVPSNNRRRERLEEPHQRRDQERERSPRDSREYQDDGYQEASEEARYREMEKHSRPRHPDDLTHTPRSIDKQDSVMFNLFGHGRVGRNGSNQRGVSGNKTRGLPKKHKVRGHAPY